MDWNIKSIKYSILKQLWVGRFKEGCGWRFQPFDGAGRLLIGAENQFYMTYPVGNFPRPCIGIEYNGKQRGSTEGSLGMVNETSTFTVTVLGGKDDLLSVEEWTDVVKLELDGKRVPFYKFNVVQGVFPETPWSLTMQPLSFVSCTMRGTRGGSDLPEGGVVFRVAN